MKTADKKRYLICKMNARKCKTNKEFYQKYQADWKWSYRRDILKQIGSHWISARKESIYDFKMCKKLALMCKTRGEFWEKYPAAATKASKNNWLDLILTHCKQLMTKHGTYRNEKKLLLLLKQAGSFIELKNNNPSAMVAIYQLGLAEKFRRHVPKKSVNNKFYLYLLYSVNRNEVYVGLSVNPQNRFFAHKSNKEFYKLQKLMSAKDFKKKIIYNKGKSFSGPQAAKKEAALIKIHLKQGWKVINRAKPGSLGGNIPSRFNSKQKCKKEFEKCTTRSEVWLKCPGAAKVAFEKGWYEDLVSHLSRPTVWNKKYDYSLCKKLALECNSKMELRKKYPAVRQVIKKNGWVELYEHMKRPEKHRKYTLNKVMKLARKFQYSSDFKKKYPGAYKAALRNDWEKIIGKHWLRKNLQILKTSKIT